MATDNSGYENQLHQVDVRFDRIEGKLDVLTDTVVSLARAEEKLLALERSNATIMTAIVKLDARISAAEVIQITLTNTHANFSRVFWAVVTGTITTGFIWYLSQHLK
jgi:hypothetical protein